MRLTLFTGTLVQDSALSVSGVDRETTADRSFTIVDDVPMLNGRSLKGAAVAMAKRFFYPLPRSVSDSDALSGRGSLVRSAWEFSHSKANLETRPKLRAGVGIFQKTGARATGVLYDVETIPKSTEWPIELKVDWKWVRDGEDPNFVEGILGYVLERHWSEGRCWIGGNVARGLGWCTLRNLKAYRLDDHAYESWVTSGHTKLPDPQPSIPQAQPDRNWFFQTLDLSLTFGEYKPAANQHAWGIDMLAVGPHSAERGHQVPGQGGWSLPPWTDELDESTDRSIVMDLDRPMLPGASVRGPLRHMFSRLLDGPVKDPHEEHTKAELENPDRAARIFGNVRTSSPVLVRDGTATGDWFAARMHMHAEDEFSAGSYEKAKRDAVRLLKGEFPIRIVVEGSTEGAVTAIAGELDRTIDWGVIGHLPVGGHKTHGAGWGLWRRGEWVAWKVDELAQRIGTTPTKSPTEPPAAQESEQAPRVESDALPKSMPQPAGRALLHVKPQPLPGVQGPLTLAKAAQLARDTAGEEVKLTAWWCEPAIDFSWTDRPPVFGWTWPAADRSPIVEEVAFFFERASWRVANTANGYRAVWMREVDQGGEHVHDVEVELVPARLHGGRHRFGDNLETGVVELRKWRKGTEAFGYTLRRT